MALKGSQTPKQQEYQRRVQQNKPKPSVIRNVIVAFIVGGAICVVGQVALNFFSSLGLSSKEAAAPTAVVMVTLGAVLTGLGWYDELGKFAGAGSAVPITGFANSIVSPALEFKREGFILGVGARMFVVAGPVLVYGTLTAVLLGFVYWLVHGGVIQL
ncbi:MAG: stage V sporulation protein AC [Firmicutes bacterium]|jgi:stage V sporulation protein AC|nr:stage V sporulation protein AC [Bacillota bacterium]